MSAGALAILRRPMGTRASVVLDCGSHEGATMRTLLSLVCMMLSAIAAAQDYPARPVTMVVPQAAGGANDILGRILAQQLSQRFRQQFVVENRVGAGGNIGTAAVAKASRDGYTLLFTIS